MHLIVSNYKNLSPKKSFRPYDMRWPLCKGHNLGVWWLLNFVVDICYIPGPQPRHIFWRVNQPSCCHSNLDIASRCPAGDGFQVPTIWNSTHWHPRSQLLLVETCSVSFLRSGKPRRKSWWLAQAIKNNLIAFCNFSAG